MDEPSPSWWWWLSLSGCLLAFLFTAFSRVAYRLLGPVTLEALVDRIGEERTEFLRKSLSSPSPFWFSLSLAYDAALLAVLCLLLAGRVSVSVGEFELALHPAGGWPELLVSYAVLFAGLALVELVLPVVAARVDRTSFVERSLPVIRVLHAAFSPVTTLFARWSEVPEDPDEEPGEQGVEAYITVGTREGILEEAEGDLLRNLLEFNDTRVREVLTPRTDVVGIEDSATVREVVELMARTRFSRIPVHAGQLDDVVGIASLKDCVQAMQEERADEPATRLMNEPYIVPESKRVSELLRELQARRQQMAIVVDEFGGTAGVITVEDLLEEIVGEIRDEHEEGEDLVSDGQGAWLARGRASLDEVGESLGTDLEFDDNATVGGLMLSLYDRVPARGESIVHAGWRFTVEDADRRRVQLVRISPADPADARAGGTGG